MNWQLGTVVDLVDETERPRSIVLDLPDWPGHRAGQHVPVRPMLRHAAATQCSTPVRLLYSARSLGEVIYREEPMRFAAHDEVDIRLTLTREWSPGWQGHRGRMDQHLFDEVAIVLTDVRGAIRINRDHFDLR